MDRFKLEGIVVVVVVVQANKVILAKKPIVLRKQKNILCMYTYLTPSYSSHQDEIESLGKVRHPQHVIHE